MSPRSSWVVRALLVGALLLGAACGTSLDAAVDAPGSEDVVIDPTTVPASPSPTATPLPTTTPVPPPTPTVFELEPGLALELPEGWSPFAGVDEVPEPSEDGPDGGRVPGRDDGEDRWSYRGVLGRLGPEDQVVAAVVDPPVTQPGTAVLTGLPGQVPERKAVIVKIDNVPAARPQTGINQADILYEELVEGGVTRFAAVFHSQAPTTIGPVRSGRSTDIGIIDSYNWPIFAFSGANSIFDRLIDKQPVANRSAEVFSGYWRSGGRPAPHNMYTGADTLLASVSGGRSPKPHFAYRGADETLPAGAEPATTVRLSYLAGGGTTATFEWAPDREGWARWQAGTPHVDSNGVQLAPQNLIVQLIDYIDVGMTDKFGEDLYEGVTVGTGTALVFTDGHVVEATWTRPRLRDATTFTDAEGRHVALTPGQTFVALIAPGGVSWS